MSSFVPAFPESMEIVDSHTGGEPTRVIVAGGPELGSGSLVERRQIFRESADQWRRAVIHEPRGNEVMVGALILPPTDPSCAAATIFFNNTGYLGMCGHGTIGLAVTLHALGRIGLGPHRIETPVGVVTATLHDANSVSIENVPAWRFRQSVRVNVSGWGRVTGDVAWGGNWFFLVRETPLPVGPIEPSRARPLVELCERIRAALIAEGVTGEGGAEIDHIELFGPADGLEADSRNFVLCPGGAWDRSPCGTGSSAKLACLAADGLLAPGQVWRQAGTTGSIFECHYSAAGDRIVPVIRGSAWISARSTLVFDPQDPFRLGLGI